VPTTACRAVAEKAKAGKSMIAWGVNRS
jgi:hypothetical protein